MASNSHCLSDKLHLVINHLGEIVSFSLNWGNRSDLQPLEQLFKNLTRLAAGDKGYLSRQKEETLRERGLRFISKVRRNMKERVLSPFEKFFLDQRGLIETVIEQLKSICQIQHTRHRKPDNFIINLLSGLTAYMLKPRKPSLKCQQLPKNLKLLLPLHDNQSAFGKYFQPY
ncbi:MAG: transposase [Proteobacteria bacterium]|nr:transposase [Pseudomonadota bacterium]